MDKIIFYLFLISEEIFYLILIYLNWISMDEIINNLYCAIKTAEGHKIASVIVDFKLNIIIRAKSNLKDKRSKEEKDKIVNPEIHAESLLIDELKNKIREDEKLSRKDLIIFSSKVPCLTCFRKIVEIKNIKIIVFLFEHTIDKIQKEELEKIQKEKANIEILFFDNFLVIENFNINDDSRKKINKMKNLFKSSTISIQAKIKILNIEMLKISLKKFMKGI